MGVGFQSEFEFAGLQWVVGWGGASSPAQSSWIARMQARLATSLCIHMCADSRARRAFCDSPQGAVVVRDHAVGAAAGDGRQVARVPLCGLGILLVGDLPCMQVACDSDRLGAAMELVGTRASLPRRAQKLAARTLSASSRARERAPCPSHAHSPAARRTGTRQWAASRPPGSDRASPVGKSTIKRASCQFRWVGKKTRHAPQRASPASLTAAHLDETTRRLQCREITHFDEEV